MFRYIIIEQILDIFPKKSPLKFEHLEDFIKCYNAKNITERVETWNQESGNRTLEKIFL